MQEDKLILIQLTKGSQKAYRKVFDNYYQDIYYYCLNLLKSKTYAEEIAQEVFLKVWLHRENIKTQHSFKSYIFTIARNLSFNFLKKAANDKVLREEIFYKSQKSYNLTDRLIITAELDLLKKQALDQLPPKRKRIFEMSRNEGKSYEEISVELGISKNTVRNQMSSALDAIRNFLMVKGDITFVLTFISSGYLS